MRQTIVALFRTHAAAQRAVEDLVAQGFAQKNICISEGDADAATINCSPGDDTVAHSGVRHFFRDRFGTYESRHAHKFVDAIREGQSMVAVHASSDAQVDRACAILDNHNPCDVDAYAETWAGTLGSRPDEIDAAPVHAAMQRGAAIQGAQSQSLQSSHTQGSYAGAALRSDGQVNQLLDKGSPDSKM